MGKSTDRNTTEEEFYKLEQVLNQIADDASNCLKLLKKQLSEYDSRNGNHFVNTASSYMRGDMRTAKDTAMDLKYVAHKINKIHKPSKTEVSSARNMMDATAEAMDTLKITARNYDKENGQSMGVKGKIDAAVGGSHDKSKDKEKDEQHGLFGKSDKAKNEECEGFLGKDDKDKEHEGSLFGKSYKEEDDHRGGVFDNPDANGGGIIGSSDTVETLVKKTLRDNFSLSALDQQDKLKGDTSSPTHEGHHHEGRHAKHTATP
ncbi:uncharacterized protein IUM83_05221 [Phytophthora cinnamomi]|uniref:uncharacterized protein n=1 Tax=Phytophthora cinnamomi TaxID=4785 RepID=UPI003559C052|nr:hypothetical protein IUM83_05221 [Phytophthora cinnamomi]